jgi:hypothetical protein
MIRKTGLALLLAFTLAGCSVLSDIANWLPFGISVLDGVVAIAAPGNTTVAADAGLGQKIFTDIDGAVAAAQAAGAGKTGLNKVLAEIQAAIGVQNKVVADLSSAGLNLPANDLAFATASENLLIAALQGFEAQLTSQGATVPPSVASSARYSAKLIKGECFGFEPAHGTVGPHVWADCDPSDPIDYTWAADPAPQAGPNSSMPPKSNAKVIKLGSLKRQYNALARKHGHPEKQVHLTVAEHLHIK